MTKKGSEKRDATVAACLTESEKSALEQFACRRRVSPAWIVQRLIQHFIESNLPMPKYLDQHRAPDFAYENTELRTHRINVRLWEEEKQTLSLLAAKGFYLPGEATRILVKLYIAGAIEENAVWE